MQVRTVASPGFTVQAVECRSGQQGFTLVEPAITLVIAGLLGSAVLAASEMRSAARGRSLMQQADALRAAYYGFADRYRALPGDAPRATIDIPGTTVNGNGDGLVGSTTGVVESVAAWEHLSHAGSLAGGYRYGTGTETPESAPLNPFGATPRLASNSRCAGAGPVRLNLHLGNLIPAPTLAEVDRKLDDGLPYHGAIRFSPIGTTGGAPDAARCLTADGAAWRIASSPESNCAITWLIR